MGDPELPSMGLLKSRRNPRIQTWVRNASAQNPLPQPITTYLRPRCRAKKPSISSAIRLSPHSMSSALPSRCRHANPPNQRLFSGLDIERAGPVKAVGGRKTGHRALSAFPGA